MRENFPDFIGKCTLALLCSFHTRTRSYLNSRVKFQERRLFFLLINIVVSFQRYIHCTKISIFCFSLFFFLFFIHHSSLFQFLFPFTVNWRSVWKNELTTVKKSLHFYQTLLFLSIRRVTSDYRFFILFFLLLLLVL